MFPLFTFFLSFTPPLARLRDPKPLNHPFLQVTSLQPSLPSSKPNPSFMTWILPSPLSLHLPIVFPLSSPPIGNVYESKTISTLVELMLDRDGPALSTFSISSSPIHTSQIPPQLHLHQWLIPTTFNSSSSVIEGL